MQGPISVGMGYNATSAITQAPSLVASSCTSNQPVHCTLVSPAAAAAAGVVVASKHAELLIVLT